MASRPESVKNRNGMPVLSVAEPGGYLIHVDQVVNFLTRADDGKVVALDQHFGGQRTGVVG